MGRPFHDQALILRTLAASGDYRVAAAELGINEHAVRYYAVRDGVLVRQRAGNGVRWNADNLGRLQALLDRTPRPSYAAMAAIMGTSVAGIYTAMSRHGMTPRRALVKSDDGPMVRRDGAAMRRCLGGCDRQFMSTHIGNRMCPRCATPRSLRLECAA